MRRQQAGIGGRAPLGRDSTTSTVNASGDTGSGGKPLKKAPSPRVYAYPFNFAKAWFQFHPTHPLIPLEPQRVPTPDGGAPAEFRLVPREGDWDRPPGDADQLVKILKGKHTLQIGLRLGGCKSGPHRLVEVVTRNVEAGAGIEAARRRLVRAHRDLERLGGPPPALRRR